MHAGRMKRARETAEVPPQDPQKKKEPAERWRYSVCDIAGLASQNKSCHRPFTIKCGHNFLDLPIGPAVRNS